MKRTIKEQLRVLVKEHERGLLPTSDYRRLRGALLEKAALGEFETQEEPSHTVPRAIPPATHSEPVAGRAAVVAPTPSPASADAASTDRMAKADALPPRPRARPGIIPTPPPVATNWKMLGGAGAVVVLLIAILVVWMSGSSKDVAAPERKSTEAGIEYIDPVQVIIEEFIADSDWTPGRARRFIRDWEDLPKDDQTAAKSSSGYRELAREVRDRLKLSETSDTRVPSATARALHDLAESLEIRVESRFADIAEVELDPLPPVAEVADQDTPDRQGSTAANSDDNAQANQAVDGVAEIAQVDATSSIENKSSVPIKDARVATLPAGNNAATRTAARAGEEAENVTRAARKNDTSPSTDTAQASARVATGVDAMEAVAKPETAESDPAKSPEATATVPVTRSALATAVGSGRSATCNVKMLGTRRKYCRDRLGDGSDGPRLAIVRTGRFRMGSSFREEEQPIHEVNVSRPFAVGATEVSFAQFEQYCKTTGVACPKNPWGAKQLPVVNVSWTDARKYTEWLSGQTGATYRLPTEAEWEYTARAGTTTDYPFGEEISLLQAHFSDTRKQDQPVAVDGALVIGNKLGLKHIVGNVSEWVEDAWFDNYSGAPGDQSARNGVPGSPRVLRGGSFLDRAPDLRSAARTSLAPDSRVPHAGFRIARDMN